MKLILLFILFGAGFAVYNAMEASKEEGETLGVKGLPPTIQAAVAQLDPNSQNAFLVEYRAKRKKVSAAYFLWICFGVHYLYLRKVGLQFAYWFTFGGVGLWAFADLFMMRAHTQRANEVIAREILHTATMSATMNLQMLATAAVLNPNPPPPAPIAPIAQAAFSPENLPK